MNERLSRYWELLKKFWSKTNKNQRIMIVSAIAAVIIVIVAVTLTFSKTEYVIAFTELNADDAAAITGYLNNQGIKYKLSEDGKSIGVPKPVATQVKIDVESQGLMKNGSIGYGIFRDNISSFGMTDNEFNILSLDAKAGEIQKLINAMNGVVSSKVMINIPQESVFLNDVQDRSTAAVVIRFQPGYRPDQHQIDTIFNLVAHSVPNLSIEDITVSDQSGSFSPSTAGGALASAATTAEQQLMFKKQFEADIQKNVYQLLSRIIGPDKVVVSVFAALNFDKRNTTEQLVTPVNTVDQKGIEISLEKIQKSYSSEGGAQGGIPGTGENDVPGYPSSADSGNTNSEENQERVNYEVNRISNQIVASPYQVKDLTINVAVEPPVKTDPNSLTAETRDAIQRILMNIVGAALTDNGQKLTDQELAQKVLVFAHPFEGNPEPPTKSFWQSPWVYAAAAAALAAIIVGAALFMRRRRMEEEIAADTLVPNAQQAIQFPSLEMEQATSESQVKKQLEQLVQKKPKEFVDLLRTWLVDD
ncbi:MAG TPA: flagellar basal-body MS-ring/collar protein FliF [Bacilli bacterium]